MKPLRLAFSDHYPEFRPESCWVARALRERFAVEIVQPTDKPSVLVYGDFGESHWGFVGKKIYLTGENMLPDFGQCDLAFTPAEIPDEPRAVRIPYYAQVVHEPERLLGTMSAAAVASCLDRSGFCSFVASNPRSPERNRAFKALNRRRQVSSGGRLFNNTGGPVPDKAAFLRRFRFDLAFENSASPGYVTEKLIEPLQAGCIPIYWGAPDVARDFNPRRMVHARDFRTWDELAAHVLQLDGDRDARMAILREPMFLDDRLPKPLLSATICDAVELLLESHGPGERRYQHRRVRGHLRAQKSWAEAKFEMLSCKLEAALWNLGWRI